MPSARSDEIGRRDKHLEFGSSIVIKSIHVGTVEFRRAGESLL